MKRWLDKQSDATPLERHLLEAKNHADPTDEARALVWKNLAGRLDSATAPAAGSRMSPKLTVAKWGALSVVTAVMTVGAWKATKSMAPTSPPTSVAEVNLATPAIAPVRVAQPETVAVDRRRDIENTPIERVPKPGKHTRAVAPASADADPEQPSGANRLGEETERLAAARLLLRQGHARESLGALRALEKDIAGGVLAEERDVLIIEALVAMDAWKEAETHARAFSKKRPSSVYLDRVRSLAGI